MALPKKDFSHLEASITMMELRQAPGDVLDRVAHGMTVYVTKNDKLVACIVPPSRMTDSDSCVVRPDGTIEGIPPVTLHRNLGSGGYGE